MVSIARHRTVRDNNHDTVAESLKRPTHNIVEQKENSAPEGVAIVHSSLTTMVKRKRKEMVPATRVDILAPESERQKAVRGFRNIVNTMYGKRPKLVLCDVSETHDGLFAKLSDDCITAIVRSLLLLQNSNASRSGSVGLEYFSSVETSSKAVCGLMLTCKRMANAIASHCPELLAEAVARKCTRVVHTSSLSTFAFTKQMRNELLSCDHVKMLRAAQSNFACHCARFCCHKIQRAFNKDISKGRVFPSPPSQTLGTSCREGNRVIPVLDNCTLLSVQQDGDYAFAFLRERMPKQTHTEDRSRRYKDVITRIKHDSSAFHRTHTIDIGSADMSVPLTMCTSHDGGCVAFVRALHEIDTDNDTPFSSAFVWRTAWKSPVVVPRPSSGTSSDTLSAQDSWFRTTPNGGLMLVVAWSTDFFFPSGHHVGSNQTHALGAQFCFTSYTVGDEEHEEPELYESTFFESGQLIACSVTSDGNKVVTIAERRDVSVDFRSVCMHYIPMGQSFVVTSAYVACGPKGPVCAAVSPTGDCIVVVGKHGKSVKATVCWQTSDFNFAPVHSMDVSMWMGLLPNQDTNDFGNDLLKAAIGVQFSPCGRFAALIDRHPLFGSPPDSHGLVVVDTAMRGKASTFRPFPMFPMSDQAPRSFHWTRKGIWLMPPGTDEHGSIGPRGGALCLYAPCKDTSFT